MDEEEDMKFCVNCDCLLRKDSENEYYCPGCGHSYKLDKMKEEDIEELK